MEEGAYKAPFFMSTYPLHNGCHMDKPRLWLFRSSILSIIIIAISVIGIGLLNTVTINHAQDRFLRTERNASLAQCRRMNDLREQDNQNSIGTFNSLAQARIALTAQGTMRLLTYSAKVQRLVAADIVKSELSRLTVTAPTNCLRAIDHPTGYHIPTPVQIQLTAVQPILGATPTVERLIPATKGPGVGKPVIRLGYKNFVEQYVLGQLYAQALAHQGYRVILKGNLGPTEEVYKKLSQGQIDLYPDYTGTLLTILKPKEAPRTSARTYTLAQAAVARNNNVLLNATPFMNRDIIVVRKSWAKTHPVTTMGDLRKYHIILGAPSTFATRANGLSALRRIYKVHPLFIPLVIGLDYEALTTSRVNATIAFTTDARLQSHQFLTLKDPKNQFGFQHEVPVVRQGILGVEGVDFTRILNKVSSLLTEPVMRQLNLQVMQGTTPSEVAHAFLVQHGL